MAQVLEQSCCGRVLMTGTLVLNRPGAAPMTGHAVDKPFSLLRSARWWRSPRIRVRLAAIPTTTRGAPALRTEAAPAREGHPALLADAEDLWKVVARPRGAVKPPRATGQAPSPWYSPSGRRPSRCRAPTTRHPSGDPGMGNPLA